MNGLEVSLEFETNFEIFEIEGKVYDGEEQTYDYCGSAPEVEIWKVIDEQGCDIKRELDYITLEHIEDAMIEYYNNR